MLIRRLLLGAARRAAMDPRVQARARQAFDQKARPLLRKKARQAKELAGERAPGEHPARFAGRIVRRLLDG